MKMANQVFLAVCSALLIMQLVMAVPYDSDDSEDYNVILERLMQTAQKYEPNMLNYKRFEPALLNYKRSCIKRGANCDHRANDCCHQSSCRCNLWGQNCRCERAGLFQQWG